MPVSVSWPRDKFCYSVGMTDSFIKYVFFFAYLLFKILLWCSRDVKSKILKNILLNSKINLGAFRDICTCISSIFVLFQCKSLASTVNGWRHKQKCPIRMDFDLLFKCEWITKGISFSVPSSKNKRNHYGRHKFRSCFWRWNEIENASEI